MKEKEADSFREKKETNLNRNKFKKVSYSCELNVDLLVSRNKPAQTASTKNDEEMSLSRSHESNHDPNGASYLFK